METYIIKRYAEVEWNERQATEQRRRGGDDRPGWLQRAATRALQGVRQARRQWRGAATSVTPFHAPGEGRPG